MNCYVCDEKPDHNVPLLRCLCYACPKCYCVLKSQKIENCLLCKNKKLIRGGKPNKVL